MNESGKFEFHLTAEHLLFGLILTAAAVLRLTQLGQIPLSPTEAVEAMAVWQLWRPVGVEMGWTAVAASPAYLHLTALLSQIMGYSDGTMRLIPALLGLAAVALPWFLRDQIGRVGALILALLLALSPTQVVTGRTAGGEAIAIFALLLLLAGWLRYQDSRRRMSLSKPDLTSSASTSSASGSTLPEPVEGSPASLSSASTSSASGSTLPEPVEGSPASLSSASTGSAYGSMLPEPAEGSSASTSSASTGSASVGPGTRWLIVAVFAVALGLTSDPLFYGGLAALVLAWLAQAYLGPAIFKTADGAPQPTTLPEGDEQRQVLWLGTAVFVALSTLFLTHLSGIGLAVNLPVGWLGRFGLPADLVSWLTPILALGRYELTGLLLGGTAVVWTTWRGDALPNFFVYWLTALLALTLLQAGVLSNALLLALPLYLLTAVWLNDLFNQAAGWEKWPLFGGTLLVGGIVVVNVASYGRLTQFDPEQTTNLLIAGLALAFVLMVVGLIASWDRAAAAQGFVAGLFVFLLAFNFGLGWRLGQEATNDPREHWVEQATDDSVRWLVHQLGAFSRQFARSETGISLYVTVDSPALRWYLRDFNNVHFGPALPATADQQALITADLPELITAESYVGSGFQLLRQDTPHWLTPQQAVRWWLFYESPIPLEREPVVLWLRADLAR